MRMFFALFSWQSETCKRDDAGSINPLFREVLPQVHQMRVAAMEIPQLFGGFPYVEALLGTQMI